MPKYEIYVERSQTFRFEREAEDEECLRQACYEEIEAGNADPYLTDWHWDIFEK